MPRSGCSTAELHPTTRFQRDRRAFPLPSLALLATGPARAGAVPSPTTCRDLLGVYTDEMLTVSGTAVPSPTTTSVTTPLAGARVESTTAQATVAVV